MNNISKQILQSHQFLLKSLVGGLLICSLIGIPFYIGYLGRYLHQAREGKGLDLPQWNNWLALLIESWELLLAFVVYLIIPGGLCFLFSSSVDQYFGIFGALLWLPTMLILVCSPIVIVISYKQYLSRATLESIFDSQNIYKTFLSSAESLIPATLTFWGAIFIGFPVFGFTIAASILIYFPFAIQEIEENRYR